MEEIKEIRICNICLLQDQPCERNRKQCRSCLGKRRTASAKLRGYHVEYCQLNKEKFAIYNKKIYYEKKAKKNTLEISV